MKKDDLPTPPYGGRAYAYVAIALCAVAAIFLGLAFSVLGIYALIASVLSGIAAICFANVQKRKNDFKYLIIIKICAYVVTCASVLIFAGGLIWSLN